jgi:NAD(P)H-flavin reductase/hemoglobin-like flavoprotein
VTAEQVSFRPISPSAHPAASSAPEPITKGNREAELVRRSFVALAPRLDQVIARFYAVLFARAPGLRALFPINMESQRGRLARVLTHVVGALDRPEDLAPFLAQLGRDHRKFDVLDEHYPVFGQALLAALAAEAGDAWTDEVATAWARTFRFMAETMAAAARAEAGPASWAGQVLDHRRLDRDTAALWVHTDPPLPYRPGQYVSVETPQRPRVWRYYTPTTAPRPDGVIELLVKAVGSGGVSRGIVSSTRPGDTWRLGPALGRLPDQISPDRDLMMIGGGTGIAPVQAMLHGMELSGQRPRSVIVYYGARNWESLHALDNLRSMSYRNRWLDVIPVVEQQPPAAGPEIGQLVEVILRDRSWADRDVLVSGSPAMLRATVGALLTAGQPLERIFYDPFVDD